MWQPHLNAYPIMVMSDNFFQGTFVNQTCDVYQPPPNKSGVIKVSQTFETENPYASDSDDKLLFTCTKNVQMKLDIGTN